MGRQASGCDVEIRRDLGASYRYARTGRAGGWPHRFVVVRRSSELIEARLFVRSRGREYSWINVNGAAGETCSCKSLEGEARASIGVVGDVRGVCSSISAERSVRESRRGCRDDATSDRTPRRSGGRDKRNMAHGCNMDGPPPRPRIRRSARGPRAAHKQAHMLQPKGELRGERS